MIARTDEGHEVLMHRALKQLDQEGFQLHHEVDPMWLTLGNVRTDVPGIELDRRVSLWQALTLLSEGFLCAKADHPRHSMRCKNQSVPAAYAQMRHFIKQGIEASCDAEQSWQQRALRFGGAMHTLQDSYCIAHALRIDNGDPFSPLIDMYTWPSREHPFTTKKDAIWADAEETALRPDAAAALTATVEALKIFVRQDVDPINNFLAHFLNFREDIAIQRHPEHKSEHRKEQT